MQEFLKILSPANGHQGQGDPIPHPIAAHLSILVLFVIHATILTTRPSYNPLSHIPQYPYYTFTNTSLRPLPLPSRPQSHLQDLLHPAYLSDSLTRTFTYIHTKKTKLRDFSPQANYTDRATAACRQS
jgi:hypothetical protein